MDAETAAAKLIPPVHAEPASAHCESDPDVPSSTPVEVTTARATGLAVAAMMRRHMEEQTTAWDELEVLHIASEKAAQAGDSQTGVQLQGQVTIAATALSRRFKRGINELLVEVSSLTHIHVCFACRCNSQLQEFSKCKCGTWSNTRQIR